MNVIEKQDLERLRALKDKIVNETEHDLMVEVQQQLVKWISEQGFTQTQAAHVLGITQPRVSNLVAGKLDKFSLPGMIRLAIKAGLKIEISLESLPPLQS